MKQIDCIPNYCHENDRNDKSTYIWLSILVAKFISYVNKSNSSIDLCDGGVFLSPIKNK